MPGYGPHEALASIDANTPAVLAFMSVAMAATFVYLVLAFRTASRHKAYPSPLLAVAFFAVHDASFVLRWNTWFGEYHHWWPQAWAIALIGSTLIELALVYMVWRYGREELCPSLTQGQFGVVIVGALIVISVSWALIKDLLVDELYLMTFVFTAFMGPAFSIALRSGRQSNRGQTVGMAWALVFTFLGIFGAAAVIDPYFRSPLFLAFAAVGVGTGLYNVWMARRYPPYVAPVHFPSSQAVPAQA